jgi:hypothetical protein
MFSDGRPSSPPCVILPFVLFSVGVGLEKEDNTVLFDAALRKMGDEPSETDKALLERLNALKPSSVQLERRKCVTVPQQAGIQC